MEYGLQVFDEDGNCILDIATVSTRLIGYGQTGKTASSLTDSRLIGQRFWVRVISCDIASAYRPWFKFNQSTGTISWSFALADGSTTADAPDCRFIYGVY